MKQVREKLKSVFRDNRGLNHLKILGKNDGGYTSIVFLISIKEKEYAVKVFHPRYNGSEISLEEREQLVKAKKIIPEAIPEVFFLSKPTKNEFHREILVMEKMKGSWLDKESFDRVFKNMIALMKRLHILRNYEKQSNNGIYRLKQFEEIITEFLREGRGLSLKRVLKQTKALKQYYDDNREAFNVNPSLIHGDLWPDNILVHDSKISIIDWLESKEQDYCLDIAQFKIGILDEFFDKKRSKKLFLKIIDSYIDDFKDNTLIRRLKFQLPMIYLEEAFYLQYDHFDWQIKFLENQEAFRNRVHSYFEKSETSFQEGQP